VAHFTVLRGARDGDDPMRDVPLKYGSVRAAMARRSYRGGADQTHDRISERPARRDLSVYALNVQERKVWRRVALERG
jgi:hypothetical protein